MSMYIIMKRYIETKFNNTYTLKNEVHTPYYAYT